MDNIKQLGESTEQVINPDGGPFSILAVDVQNLLKTYLEKLGKYTGFPYIAQSDPIDGEVQVGFVYWSGVPQNQTESFFLMMSKTTADGLDMSRVLNLMSAGDFVKWKDYEGRTTTLSYIGYELLNDTIGQQYIKMTVSGFAENNNYAYQPSDTAPSVMEFIKAASASGRPKSIRVVWDGSSAITVPASFVVDSILNANEPALEVTTSLAGTSLTITDGAEAGQVLLINGNY